jgi:lysozyme
MNLVDQLRRDEGVRYQPYQDSLGNWTVGCGHKMTLTEHYFMPLSDVDVDRILKADIADKQAQLHAFSWFNVLDDCRQAALTNMAFNLGVNGLLHFPHMLSCIADSDWQGAHDQALASTWAAQVGARATRIAEQILTGQWI